MCKLKGGMDKGGYYDVEMKGWIEKRAICIRANFEKGWMDMMCN